MISSERNNAYRTEKPTTTPLSIFRTQWQDPQRLREIMKGSLQAGEPLVERLSIAPLPTLYGDWTHVLYGDKTTGKVHEVVIHGNLQKGALGDGEEVMVRIHSSHKPNEIWGAHTSDDREQLEASMKKISEVGKGVIVYLNDEGRGHGEVGQHQQFNKQFYWENDEIRQRTDPDTNMKIHASRAYQEAGLAVDARTFEDVNEILDDLEIKSVILLTNNPNKIKGLTEKGVNIVGHVPLHTDSDHPITQSYHEAQREGGYMMPKSMVVYSSTDTV